jgi:hypothetical protein
MLKRILLTLFAIALFVPSYSQHPDWDKVAVTYMQPPLMPVSPMAKKYFMQVYMNHTDLYNTNSYSTNYTPIVRTVDADNPILRIAGCTQISDSIPDFTVLVTFLGFKITNINPNTSYIISNGVSVPQCKYIISYYNVVSVQIINANGGIVRQYVVTDSDRILSRTSPVFNSRMDADNWWNNSYTSSGFLQSCDNEAYQHSLKCAQLQLNNELGYQVKTIYVDVATVKKPEYADLTDAFSNVSRGYDLLSSNKERASDYVLKAISIWENALQESNLTNKKARINEHITASLYENLAVAYCFMEEWELSQNNILKLGQFDVGGSLKNKINKAELFKADYMARINANKTN